MEKLDLKTQLRHLYGPSAKEPAAVEVPALGFLMIDGEGDPNTSKAYAEAVEALFALAYALKFAVKKGVQAIDYGVMPLEGLWWADDMTSFTSGDRSDWKWTTMIMQPAFISRELVGETAASVTTKKGLPGLSRVRFETFEEGLAAQIMHLGPFSGEGPTIERLHAFILASGCELFGKHHEVYLSDIRKADPAKWKTVIRQPMR